MKVIKKERSPSSFKSLKTYNTTYIWAIDGWTYNIFDKKRMRFLYTEDNMLMEEQTLQTMAIPQCLYKEDIQIHVLSFNQPYTWIEEGNDWKEMYVSFDVEKI